MVFLHSAEYARECVLFRFCRCLHIDSQLSHYTRPVQKKRATCGAALSAQHHAVSAQSSRACRRRPKDFPQTRCTSYLLNLVQPAGSPDLHRRHPGNAGGIIRDRYKCRPDALNAGTASATAPKRSSYRALPAIRPSISTAAPAHSAAPGRRVARWDVSPAARGNEHRIALCF